MLADDGSGFDSDVVLSTLPQGRAVFSSVKTDQAWYLLNFSTVM